jgi:hypothetical protein
MKKMKILFILKKKENGTNYSINFSSGLYNSAKFVSDMLIDKLYYESKMVEVNDNNDIDKEVTLFKPDIVIIEALWVVPEKFTILSKLHKNVKWIIRIHSEITFLATEGNAMAWLSKYVELQRSGINIHISTNSKRCSFDLEKTLRTEVYYLPNYYKVDYNLINNKKENIYLNIGCFGAIRPMKNILKQAIVAIIYGDLVNKKVYFHINSGRVEHGENTLKNLRGLFKNQKHELVEHDWLSHSDFNELIKTMDFGMQLSLSETFNIVTADFVNNNIPIVVSNDIMWMPFFTKANPLNTNEILKVIKNILFLKYFNINKLFLMYKMFQSVNSWKNSINRM